MPHLKITSDIHVAGLINLIHLLAVETASIKQKAAFRPDIRETRLRSDKLNPNSLHISRTTVPTQAILDRKLLSKLASRPLASLRLFIADNNWQSTDDRHLSIPIANAFVR